MCAVDAYRRRLKANIERTGRRLQAFENRYAASTAHFLQNMAAEDLAGGDIEYVEWAGEAKLLAGLNKELAKIDENPNKFGDPESSTC